MLAFVNATSKDLTLSIPFPGNSHTFQKSVNFTVVAYKFVAECHGMYTRCERQATFNDNYFICCLSKDTIYLFECNDMFY